MAWSSAAKAGATIARSAALIPAASASASQRVTALTTSARMSRASPWESAYKRCVAKAVSGSWAALRPSSERLCRCATRAGFMSKAGARRHPPAVYNGFPADTISAHGAARDGIDKAAKNGIAGRGVLLDIARLKGVDWLQPGEVISPADLDAACAAQGVEVRAGDIVLLRTGWWRKFLSDRDRLGWIAGEPGLGIACCDWLWTRDVAAVCADNYGIEAMPAESEGEMYPLHLVLIRDMGMMFGEVFDLEELAADCAADGVYEFLFAGPPIEFTHAVGSPVNPLAIK